MDLDAGPLVDQKPESPRIAYSTLSSGRKVPRKFYRESASSEDFMPEPNVDVDDHKNAEISRATQPNGYDEDDEDEDQPQPRHRTRSQSKINNIIESDDESRAGTRRYPMRKKTKKRPVNSAQNRNASTRPTGSRQDRPRRLTRRSAQEAQQEGDYVDHPSSGSADADASFEDAARTSSEPEELVAEEDLDADADGELELEPEVDGKPYSLRQRAKINYAIPPPLEETKPKGKPNGGRGGRNGHGGHSKAARGLGWSASGAELGRWMGLPADDSVSRSAPTNPYILILFTSRTRIMV